MLRRFAFAAILFFVVGSMSTHAQKKTRFPLLPIGVWVGVATDNQEEVAVVLQKVFTKQGDGRPDAHLDMTWIDSRGPGLSGLSFGKAKYRPDGVKGVAMQFTAKRSGLVGSKNPKGPEEFYGLIDMRPNGTLRVCYFDEERPAKPLKISLANGAKDGARCLDFERLNRSGHCVRACITRDSARAVSAEMIANDCKRRCGGRYP